MITDFITHITKVRGYSANTALAYGCALRSFSRYALSVDGGIGWRNVTQVLVESYVASMAGHGASAVTIRLHVSALRTFFGWLVRRGLMQGNPARYVSTPKPPCRLPSCVPSYSIERAISGAGLQAAAIIATLYDTGLRLSELLSIDTRNVEKWRHAIRIVGKGNRERIVFYRERTARLLNSYLGGRRGVVFPGLSPEDVRRIVYAEFDKLGVSASPHRLRHSFATGLLCGGASIEATRQLLGHKSVKTTQRYIHTGMPWLMEQYERATSL